MDCCNGKCRVEVVTLGCKVNQAESRDIMAALTRRGYELAASWERPEIVIVNTCVVTKVSEAKSRKEISRALRRGARGLVVTGCMVDIADPGQGVLRDADLLVSRADKRRLPELVEARFPPREPAAREEDSGALKEGGKEAYRTRAFIKAQDGCDRRCSYCIVPLARGRAVSLSLEEILGKVRGAVEEGEREVVLCGVNLGAWRGDKGEGLASLVEEVLSLGDGFRVRLSSLDPEDVDAGLFRRLHGNPRLCPHFHMPLQSGSDGVLARMGRGYGAEDYVERVREIRSHWVDPAVTTDVMVGFPGETEKDFTATLDVVREVKPTRLHVFRYSRRPGTEASLMAGQVPEEVKRIRASGLSRMGEELSLEYAERQVGKVLEVLVEKREEEDGSRWATGTTDNYLKAEVPGEGIAVGGLFRVKVEGTKGSRVTAEICERG